MRLRPCTAVLAMLTLLAGPARAQADAARTEPNTDAQQPVDLALAYESEDSHHLRTLTEVGITVSAFGVGYWGLRSQYAPDWDFPTLNDRLSGAAWRYDNNQLILNYWLHPAAGGGLYALARANHHSPATSFLYSTLGSALWEFVVEYREFVSVNDLWATSIPGVPIGEFLHKLGLYLDSAESPSTGLQMAQLGLVGGVQLDRRLDKRPRQPAVHRDNLGLTSAIWHDFEVRSTLHAGRATNAPDYGAYGLAFRGELVSLPGYGRARSFSKGFHRVDFASLELGTEASRHGAGIRMSSHALLAGGHFQNLQHGAKTPAGGSATVGVSLAHSYLQSYASGFAEQFGAVHLPGLGVRGKVQSRVGAAELRARLNPDFVGVSAYDYEDWMAQNPGELGKHILRNQGYYYGFGGSSEVRSRLRLGPMALEGAVFFGRYRSEQGLNRWQERITIDVPAGTDLLQYQVRAELAPENWPLRVGAGALLRRWTTFIGEVERRRESLTRGVELSVRF